MRTPTSRAGRRFAAVLAALLLVATPVALADETAHAPAAPAQAPMSATAAATPAAAAPTTARVAANDRKGHQKRHKAHHKPHKHHNKHGKHHRARAQRTHGCSQSNPVGCIRQATAKYGGNVRHHVACARSESGLNPRSVNAGGSGASGLFQFMPTTYKATLSRMGLKPKSIWSAKWNAHAAVWKFNHDGFGEWTGPGC
jgi:hypothetical protein